MRTLLTEEPAGMNPGIVDVRITTVNGFEAERERWERLYRADAHGQVFLSWAWLRAYLAQAAPGWMILALRDGDELVAALPLTVRAAPSRRLPIARELAFASDPVADYQGMLCLPNREHEAVRAFAGAIRALRWDRGSFSDVADPRFVALLDRLRGGGDTVATTGETRCRRALLPATWDEYANSLGASTRGTTLRSLRRMRDDLPNFRITSPADGDVGAHVDAMVATNHARWGGNLARMRAKYGRLFRTAHDTGCLRLFVAWDGDRPIAGCASFVDDVRGTYNLYQVGYDPQFAKYSPGKAMLGVVIRDAIEGGYRIFDFLRGDESYKASYAGGVLTTTHHRVNRRSVRAAVFDAVLPAYRAVKIAAVRVVYGPGRTV